MSDIFKIKNCPVCDSSDFASFMDVPDWLVSKETFNISKCTSCGFKFTSDAPSENLVGPYYNSEEYVEHSDTKSGLIYSLYHKAREFMLSYKLRIISKMNVGKKLLDVGSGSGYFLNKMATNGYDVTGVEISDKAVELCKKNFGITANSPQDFLTNKLDKDYDLITLWHVFEHVYSFEEYFDLFSNSLKDGGRLILALPNSDSTDADLYQEHWAAYDMPRHLWHFTPDTLELFASKRGFKLVKKHTLALDPFFISMVSASYKKNFTFLPITLLKAFYSFTISLFNIDKSSSLIYVLEKV